MKTIGLIGGMSWETTIPYYKIINEEIKTKLGGLHSAKIILYSVDFDEIEKCQSCGNWEKSAFILGEAAKKLDITIVRVPGYSPSAGYGSVQAPLSGLSYPVSRRAEAPKGLPR